MRVSSYDISAHTLVQKSKPHILYSFHLITKYKDILLNLNILHLPRATLKTS